MQFMIIKLMKAFKHVNRVVMYEMFQTHEFMLCYNFMTPNAEGLGEGMWVIYVWKWPQC